MKTIRVIGIDPGLNNTGWGIVEKHNNTLKYIASGVIITKAISTVPSRLAKIYRDLNEVINEFKPQHSSIEETYVNKNFESSLKLAQARAVSMLTLELNCLDPVSYPAKRIKSAVTGYGNADKQQMIHMINLLLPLAREAKKDAADALAIAICHINYSSLLSALT